MFGQGRNKKRVHLRLRRDSMKINDVRKIGKEMRINTYAMKKKTSSALFNSPKIALCASFATERVAYCNEDKCSWRGDCLSINNSPKPSPR
jgi:hypothetical protein